MAEVTVITPAYNQAAYLPDALNSLLAQTFTNWECIIVDDGSTDDTSNVAAGYTEKDGRIKYYRTDNGGPSAARNFGIQRAQGKYILPLDGDDKVAPNYIAECLQKISSSEKIKLVYGKGEKFGLVNGPWKLRPYTWETLLMGNCIHPCGMFRKADWEEIGGYDPFMREGLEDWEFWISLLNKAGEAVMVDTTTFYWRIKAVSRTTLLKSENKVARMTRYVYYKHAELYGAYFTDPMELFQQYKELKASWHWVNKHPLRFLLSRLKKRLFKYSR